MQLQIIYYWQKLPVLRIFSDSLKEHMTRHARSVAVEFMPLVSIQFCFVMQLSLAIPVAICIFKFFTSFLLISKMTFYVWSGMLNPTDSHTYIFSCSFTDINLDSLSDVFL